MIWRIRDRSSFVRLRRDGVRARARTISVSFVASGDGDPPRVAYAIGRKFGTAVARNRMRRQLRGALTELTNSADITLRGGLYLITPSSAAARMPHASLKASLSSALTQVQEGVPILTGAP